MNIPGSKVLAYLQARELLHPVQLADPGSGRPVDRLFAIGLGDDEPDLDPVELLQAACAGGVVCYFTALQFYELTTQIPPHHHIARHADRWRSATSVSVRTDRDRKLRTKRSPPDPLGKLQFAYRGVPYYLTHRDRRRIPGIQTRYYSNRTIFRVTTVEQTLLDTLHRPLNCGGQAVVFESWETALPAVNERRLLGHLQAIGACQQL